MVSMLLERCSSTPYETARGFSRYRAVIAIQIVWLVLLMALGLLKPLSHFDEQKLVYPTCLMFTITMLWMLASWRLLRGTSFDLYALFLLAAGLFNGGQALLEVVGCNPAPMLDGRFAPDALVRSVYLVTVSLTAMHAGALAGLAHRADARGNALLADSHRGTRLTGITLVASALVPAIFLFRGFLSIVMEYGYAEIYRQNNGISSLWSLSGFIVPGFIFWFAGSRAARGSQRLCILLFSFFVLLHLFMGERAAAVMTAVAIAWLIERQGRRIPRPIVAALGVAALIVFAAVKQTRDTAGWSRLSWDQQIENLASLENPLSKSVAEMGHTMTIVAHTISLVPETRNFDFGVSYLYGATSVLPNLGWSIHPSVAHGLLCEWITRTVEPMVAAAGGGLGYSFIAEAYLNFGWAGGPLFVGLLGYVFCRLFRQGDSSDPTRQALAASFLSVILVFARGESAIVARGVVWYSFAPYILARLLTARRRRKLAKESSWTF